MNPVPPPELHQIIYVSAAKKPFSAADLTVLLTDARANNGRLGVSGMLVHRQGSFFQILEGLEPAVTGLYRHISADPRHERILVLMQGSLARRSFGNWSMGFVEGDQEALHRIAGFNDFFRQGFARAELTNAAAQGKELALAFRDGRFRQFVDGR